MKSISVHKYGWNDNHEDPGKMCLVYLSFVCAFLTFALTFFQIGLVQRLMTLPGQQWSDYVVEGVLLLNWLWILGDCVISSIGLCYYPSYDNLKIYFYIGLAGHTILFLPTIITAQGFAYMMSENPITRGGYLSLFCFEPLFFYLMTAFYIFSNGGMAPKTRAYYMVQQTQMQITPNQSNFQYEAIPISQEMQVTEQNHFFQKYN